MRVDLGGLPRANLDPLHLERIIANLLTRAVAAPRPAKSRRAKPS